MTSPTFTLAASSLIFASDIASLAAMTDVAAKPKQVVIKIVCTKMGEKFTMMVCDDGIGFEINQKLENPKSLGITLIKALTQQIGGSIKTAFDKGTTYYISFEA